MVSDFIFRNKTLIGAILIMLILAGSALIIFGDNDKDNIRVADDETITIDIEGAVNKPGLYQIKKDSLIQDAINLAGGLSQNADIDKISQEINRADMLKPNQKIYLPQKSSQNVAGVSSDPSKINLNSATLEQLDSLPGIGPVYAQRIIDFRIQNNGFSSTEQVLEIEGIGEKTFEKIKDMISI